MERSRRSTTYLDQREGKGITLGGCNVSVLAFADDLIISKSEEDIQLVAEYFSALGTYLTIAKCNAFTSNPLHKTWAILKIKDQEVKYVDPDEVIRYLGVSSITWK
ncbi:unnamed protein product [Acanthoscelides obtectus]|uniref:Reverse transcriptase domain-containing protein n=1 Tax=Acanthoscelides obtectus TaxID=200917 RepID=A0A9P0LCA5_ACAOB|nr:unnamed protein product [Acanthoscelides obtectus]CAK1681975.1 hypothetical protein AOBTE_LOCUS33359 [Acanthoscelides obtectus]